VSETDDGLLGRTELETAFTALGNRLKRRGIVADLFVVGGAAMALPMTLFASLGMLTLSSYRME
jgi:hypothetical protein